MRVGSQCGEIHRAGPGPGAGRHGGRPVGAGSPAYGQGAWARASSRSSSHPLRDLSPTYLSVVARAAFGCRFLTWTRQRLGGERSRLRRPGSRREKLARATKDRPLFPKGRSIEGSHRPSFGATSEPQATAVPPSQTKAGSPAARRRAGPRVARLPELLVIPSKGTRPCLLLALQREGRALRRLEGHALPLIQTSAGTSLIQRQP